jgi:hypothetical protein
MLTHDYKPTLRSHTHWQATQCNRTDQSLPKSMPAQPHGGQESTGYNTGLAKVAVQCSADTIVVNQSLVLRINICGENRHPRQARKR